MGCVATRLVAGARLPLDRSGTVTPSQVSDSAYVSVRHLWPAGACYANTRWEREIKMQALQIHNTA